VRVLRDGRRQSARGSPSGTSEMDEAEEDLRYAIRTAEELGDRH